MSQSQAEAGFEKAKQYFIEGIACFESGRFVEAEQRFVGSLELLPDRISTLVNLAATRLRLSRPQEALEATDRILAAEPANVDAWFHRGNAFADLGRQADALASFDQLLKHDDQHAAAWQRHGQTLQSLERHEAAIGSYQRALAIDPSLALAWTNLGGIHREMKRLDEAAHAFEQALANGGDLELNRYYLASVKADRIPPAAPGHYVETLFDDYAGQFDEHLVGVLGYRAHKVLTAHIPKPPRGRFESALDLGCGTGLCGPALKPMVQRLGGVDLSSRMLDKARELGLYDELVHADIVQHLRETGRLHDLVVSADVFIYVGDLAPVFAAAHRAMRSGGIFCFSAELACNDRNDFELLSSLRYAHSERYVRELANTHGFEVADLLFEPIREDQRESIKGMFVYLAKC